MTRIKLCGMSRMEDINAVNRILPHDIGFVFYERSRRYVSPEQAAKLRERLNPSVRAIGVFVDELPDRVAEYLRRGMIDAAQLHGSEDNSYRSAEAALQRAGYQSVSHKETGRSCGCKGIDCG